MLCKNAEQQCEILIVFPPSSHGDPLEWSCEQSELHAINLSDILNSEVYRGIYDHKEVDSAFIEVESRILQEIGIREIFHTEFQCSIDQYIIIIQFPNTVRCWDFGKLVNIYNNKFGHTVNTLPCSSGSPIIKWSSDKKSKVIGIHVGYNKSKIIREGQKGTKVSENEGVPIEMLVKNVENDYNERRNKEKICNFDFNI